MIAPPLILAITMPAAIKEHIATVRLQDAADQKKHSWIQQMVGRGAVAPLYQFADDTKYQNPVVDKLRYAFVVFPMPPVEERKGKKAIAVCVSSGNPITASIFANRQLEYFGSGNYTYSWRHNPMNCPPGGPVVLGIGPSYTNKLHDGKYAHMREWGSQLQNIIVETGNELCGAEEVCRYSADTCPEGNASLAWQRSFRKADFHQFYSDDREGSWKASHLPLGVEYNFKPATDALRGFGVRKRTFLFNLWYRHAGSYKAHENTMHLLVGTKKKTLQTALEVLQLMSPAMYGGGAINFFHEPEGTLKQRKKKYRRVLLDSLFTLCPMVTDNQESFRIYEALEAGSIPVIITGDNVTYGCVNSLRPFVDSGAPFVIEASWEQAFYRMWQMLQSTDDALVHKNKWLTWGDKGGMWKGMKHSERPADLDGVVERQQRAYGWYQRFMREAARRFEAKLEEKWATFSRDKSNGPQRRRDAMAFYDQRKRERAADQLQQCNASRAGAGGGAAQQHGLNKAAALIPLVTGCGRSGTLSIAEYLSTMGLKSKHEDLAEKHISVSWLYAADVQGHWAREAMNRSRRARRQQLLLPASSGHAPEAAMHLRVPWRTQPGANGVMSGSNQFAVDDVPFESADSKAYRQKLDVARRSLSATQHLAPIFGPVVHLTRHPLKVISSVRRCFCGTGNISHQSSYQAHIKSWRFIEDHMQHPWHLMSMDYHSIERAAVYWLGWNRLIEARFRNSSSPYMQGYTQLQLESLKPAQLIRALGPSCPAYLELAKKSKIRLATRHASPEQAKQQLPDVTWQMLAAEVPGLAKDIFELAQHYGYERGKRLDRLLKRS
jgi:hypothetical protein